MQGLTFWILRRGFWIPGTGFRIRLIPCAVELGFRTPLISGIPDSLSWIMDPGFRITLHVWAKRLLEELACVACKWKYIKESFKVRRN